MEKIIEYVKERYNNMPMFVTENGEWIYSFLISLKWINDFWVTSSTNLKSSLWSVSNVLTLFKVIVLESL